MNADFWKGRAVFVTGHTGFKGSWLCTWLQNAGANVTGYALAPDTQPSLYEAAALARDMTSILADVRDPDVLRNALKTSGAEVVFHLAAQSLVRESYRRPLETYAVNVMGTANVLEAIRQTPSVRAAVIVTSDKCYENREWPWAYRENEPLGGHDPYSSSKACAELVTAAFRSSFFHAGGVALIASARAGNVIGGGDWAPDRLVPDLIRAFTRKQSAAIRNPAAIRPWQHVLEPLHGYLLLAERLAAGDRECAMAWNFGPYDADVRPVRSVADALAARWGEGSSWVAEGSAGVHEAMTLKVDSSRARAFLGWRPRLDVGTAIDWIVEWHRRFSDDPHDARRVTVDQIRRYEELGV